MTADGAGLGANCSARKLLANLEFKSWLLKAARRFKGGGGLLSVFSVKFCSLRISENKNVEGCRSDDVHYNSEYLNYELIVVGLTPHKQLRKKSNYEGQTYFSDKELSSFFFFYNSTEYCFVELRWDSENLALS